MVKGVNKNIIEVNDTGSEFFEKIVFYVSPKFASLGAKSLKKASEEIEKTLLVNQKNSESLRIRVKKKNQKRKIIVISSSCAVLISFGIFLLKVLL